MIPDTAAQMRVPNSKLPVVPIRAVASGMTVVFTYPDKTITKLHGTHPNRDNNPGDIHECGLTRKYGSIGRDCGFAIFPNPQSGWNALVALLKDPTYRLRTIRTAIEIYAPKKENNTEKYISDLCRITNHKETDTLSSLTNPQIVTLAKTIAVIEGWKGERYKG